MKNQPKKIAVLTSGGDAPGMNAALRAVVRASVYYGIECYAIHQGYQGLIDNEFELMNARSVNNIINKGGTIIRSARCLEFRTPEGRKLAHENLKKAAIDALVVIGGDGSFTGAMIFQEEHNFPVIGIPGTIDNDIFGTRYTLGYDTAINTVVEAIDKIRDTASSHNRLFFVEVMGREILIPEENLGLPRLLESLKKSEKSGKSSSIVVVAEGDKTGKNVFEIASYVEQNLPYYEVRVSVLGHMQRGGSPSCFDRVLASRMGVFAVESLLAGKSNVMVGVIDDNMILTPLEKAIKGKSEINENLIKVSDILSI
ncbi:6-phosphofructokinase [Flavobacteriaceae bacterium]|nr:6-phosphofructokinase [Flavobacteriaceae bacterium]